MKTPPIVSNHLHVFFPEQSLLCDYSIHKSKGPFKRDYMEEKLFQALFTSVFTCASSQIL